jgi:hypothetical protein
LEYDANSEEGKKYREVLTGDENATRAMVESTFKNIEKGINGTEIVTLYVPIYDFSKTPQWTTVQVHKNVSKNVYNVFCRLFCGQTIKQDYSYFKGKGENEKDTFPKEDGENKYLINGEHYLINTIAGFELRDKKSAHSYGLAIDINKCINKDCSQYELNPDLNPYSIDNFNKLKYRDDTNKAIRTCNHPVVRAFLEEGFGWGIYIKTNHNDYMHFSYLTHDFTVKEDNFHCTGNKLVGSKMTNKYGQDLKMAH